MAKVEYKCPYCGAPVRVNTKWYWHNGDTKQAACISMSCQAKGPMAETLEDAKKAFGIEVPIKPPLGVRPLFAAEGIPAHVRMAELLSACTRYVNQGIPTYWLSELTELNEKRRFKLGSN